MIAGAATADAPCALLAPHVPPQRNYALMLEGINQQGPSLSRDPQLVTQPRASRAAELLSWPPHLPPYRYASFVFLFRAQPPFRPVAATRQFNFRHDDKPSIPLEISWMPKDVDMMKAWCATHVSYALLCYLLLTKLTSPYPRTLHRSSTPYIQFPVGLELLQGSAPYQQSLLISWGDADALTRSSVVPVSTFIKEMHVF